MSSEFFFSFTKAALDGMRNDERCEELVTTRLAAPLHGKACLCRGLRVEQPAPFIPSLLHPPGFTKTVHVTGR